MWSQSQTRPRSGSGKVPEKNPKNGPKNTSRKVSEFITTTAARRPAIFTTTPLPPSPPTQQNSSPPYNNKKQKQKQQQQQQQKGTWRTLLSDQVEPPSVERWTHPERAGESSPPPVSPSPLLTSIAMPPSKTESTAWGLHVNELPRSSDTQSC